ncbi:MAG: hypothetical protein HIU91_12225 [Acidobacteria bacterium]|nr:hypothetical protein [Acidobacteriota bacterium]
MQKELKNVYFRTSILLIATLSGVGIGACGFLVDRLVHHADRLYASDFYTTLVAFLFSYTVMIYQVRRRRMLLRRMQIAAEVNHHIRNALSAIVYTAAVQGDADLQAVIQDATARIDWVLSTVLPDGEDELRWPVQVTSWIPSAWKREPIPGTHDIL